MVMVAATFAGVNLIASAGTAKSRVWGGARFHLLSQEKRFYDVL